MKVFLLAGLAFLLLSKVSESAVKSVCIECHKKVTPGIVKQHLEGKMSKAGIDCSTCHGKEHSKMDDAHLAKCPLLRHAKAAIQSRQDSLRKESIIWHGYQPVQCLCGPTSQRQSLAQVIRDADLVFADAIREVQGLYKDGVLKKPDTWTVAPDLLQFYEAKSAAEQDLYVMFLEYRMRAFEGAFHMNPDYMHWYGWAPMKETLQKIKDEAEKLRAEKSSKK